jgi:hypothetical protein
MTTSGATTTADAMVAIEGLRHCLETGDWERLPEVYAPDALLDANVPQWRAVGSHGTSSPARAIGIERLSNVRPAKPPCTSAERR